MEMISQNEGTAAEIAYKVGFGSPAYFNKCFHDYYGFPPGEYKKSRQYNQDQAILPEIYEPSQENSDTKILTPKINYKRKYKRHQIMIHSAILT